MRIVIDLQGAQSASRHRGIGRYSLALAQAMVRNRGEHEILIALNGMFPETIEPIRAAFYNLLPQENIRVWNSHGPVNANDSANTWRRDSATFIRETFLASLQPDILHITSLFDGFGDNSIHSIGKSTLKIPTAVTFYDAIPLIEEEKYLSPNPDYEKFYRTQLKFLSNADLFLAISESSRQEAITHLNLDACKITNIAAAVGLDFKPKEISTSEVQKIRTHFGLSRPFIMYSGATDERKNHLRLIKAFSLLSPEIKEKYQIAIVGGLPDENKNKFEQYASYYGIKPTDLIITGSVTDEQMINLYNICDLFVFPSWHEGFGLPALEAMSCGAAVIGSNTTSIPEVIGREDALFDPFDANSICEKITDVLTNETLRKELSEHGIEYSKNFSWDESARRSISAFEKFYVSNQKKSNIIDTSTLNAGLLSTLIKNISTISKATYHQKDLLKISEAISNNHKTSDNKQLLIDISQLVNVDSKTGIQRVVRSILYELLTSPPKGFTIEAVYATSEKNGYKYARRFISNFLNLPTIDIDDESINVFNGDIFLGLDLQPHVVLKQASTYENWKNIGVKIYFTIYDLLPISLPNKFPDGAYSAHSKWLTILGKADGALCISRAVADEMADWLETCSPKRLRPFKLGWFHLGADVSSSVPSLGFTIDNENTLKKLSNCPTFLMVGTIEPRKGQMQTLLAFEALWGQSIDVNLVIVGKRGWNVDLLIEMLRNHPEHNQRLFWLDGISDEYLEKVYAASTCLIAASEGEGFGLPLIEAAQHKLPIIARDIPVFREVAGAHAHFFSGLTPADLANSIAEWLRLEQMGKAPYSDSMPWLTWQQSTQQLLDVILGEQWYQEWMPDDVHRYWGSDQRLGTQVGIRSGRNIEANGKAGYLLFGPYLALAAGQYQIALHGHFGVNGAQGALLDIASESGTLVVSTAPLVDTTNPCLISHVFTLEHATSDLEVRVWVNEGTELTISLLEIAAHSDNDNQIVLEHQVQANEPSVAPEAQAQKVEVSTSTPSESKASNKYPNKKPSPSYSNKRKNKR